MTNDARPTRRSSGKSSSLVPVSGSVSGDTSGLRRSTRCQNNSSPVSVRKSQRLVKVASPTTTPSPGKKKGGVVSPVQRDNRLQTPSSKGSPSLSKGLKQQSLKTPEGSKERSEKKDKTLKEIAEEGQGQENQISGVEENSGKEDKTLKEIAEEARVHGKQDSSQDVGSKRKKRLNAREFRAMFKLPKKIEVSEPESKKRKLEKPDDNVDSNPGDLREGLQVNYDEDADSDLRNSEERVQDDCNEVAHSGRETMGDCAVNMNGGTEGFNPDAKKNLSTEKPGESEDGEGVQVSRAGNLFNPSSPSSPGTWTEKNIDNREGVEVNDSVMEKLLNQELHPASDRLSNDVDGSGCSQNGLTCGASAVGGAETCTAINVAPSVSCTCKMIFSVEECANCSKKPRLDYDSPKQALCCCPSNSMNAANQMSVSKDSVECPNATDDHGQKMKQNNPPVDADESLCIVCKRGGKLLYCGGKGCQRSCHPSCLWTRDSNVHLSSWYCSGCTKKKLALGVHSVSDGIEAVLDVREVDLSNSEGVKKQKQYLVKYRGLAHIHNHWIPERRLLNEAPELLWKLNERIEWKPEWAVPHRLLLRRALIIDDRDACLGSNGQHEWLVKWRGLDYDQATWELEDSACFKKPEVQRLLKEYETRHNRTSSTYMSRDNEVQERVKSSYVKPGRNSVGGLPGADSCFLNSVNKLLEYYHKGHNAVLFDEQDRVVKMIYFVSSIVNNVSQPFLIITPHTSYWEGEFLRLGTSINVVVYGGNTDARKIIRSLEFYEEGGQVMLQVLLSSIEAVSEDMKELKGIDWESVIVDDCQESCILANSGFLKTLATNWRLLLLNAQLKDTVAEYTSILSLLEPGGNSNEDINVLKERLSSFIVCARFQEYWVPVEISNLQLEQYCCFMLSNSTVLRSCSKSDPVGSLCEVLISSRKCCDHPYIVNPSLRKLLFDGRPQDTALILGVRASGKLQLLDKLLPEFRNQELKVVIIFQSVAGTGKDNLGIILDDFLAFRFGYDSYEHVAVGGQPSKKQVALNKFNKEKEISFLLLETRACLPSIKLSSVDAVIILNSDWNPLNDLRALQKIIIDSKLKQVKVFRLYCSCTVEEKVLVLAKNDMMLDNNPEVINPSTKQMLLMWGSSYLFTRLNKFHSDKVNDDGDSLALESSLLTDVCQEIVSFVQNRGSMSTSKYVSEARHDGRCYLKNIPLLGEQVIQLDDGVPSHAFWMNLLEGKQPQWKYLSGSSERNRKRVHYSDELHDQNDEAAKRRKKIDSTHMDSSPRKVGRNPENLNNRDNEHQELVADDSHSYDKDSGPTMSIVANGNRGSPDSNIVEPDDRTNLHDQRGLFEILKPAVLRLCEILLLKDEEKILAERFLEYVVNNHRVTREPETILQAFQISVCWTAAAVLKKNIDHQKSLAIARDKMDFKCLEHEADFIYSKMKLPMKFYLSRWRDLRIPSCSNDPSSGMNGTIRGSRENCEELPLGSLEKITLGLEGSSLVGDYFNKEVLSPVKTNDKDNGMGYILKVQKKCEKQMLRVKDKQDAEQENFESFWEGKRVELEKKYKLESAAMRYSHGNSAIGIEKLKILDDDYVKNREDLESQISNHRKELEARQLEERANEQKKIARFLELVKPIAHEELLEKSRSGNSVQLQTAEHIGPSMDSNQTVCIAGNLLEQQNSVREASGTPEPSVLQNVSGLNNNLENIAACEIPFQSEKQKVGSENDVSADCLGNVPTNQGAGTRDLVKEAPIVLGEPQGSLVSLAGTAREHASEESAPEQLCASAGENEKDANQMDAVVVDRSTELLQSPLSTSMTQHTADGSRSQGLGDKFCPRRADGAEEQVQQVFATRESFCGGEASSLARSNPMSSDPSHNEGTRVLGATEYSLAEPVTLSSDYNQTSITSNGRLVNEQNGFCLSARNTVSQVQLESGVDRVANANLGQGDTYISVTAGAFPAHPSYPNPISMPTPTISRVSPSYYSDPLQNECDRIRKEIRENINTHEETKLQLKTECDKEIEELVAQIRRKYDAKLEEAESLFSLKKNELEKNHNMVMMNKMLADAFRSKCTDCKAGQGLQQGGMQKGISSNSVENLPQLRPTTRPSAAAGSAPAVPTEANPHATPPLRDVYPSSGPSSTLTRSPHINSQAPTGGHQQVRHEIHSPAPHVQLRSSSSPMYSCSVQTCNVVQPANNNPASSSSSQIPLRPKQPLQLPPLAFRTSHDQSVQADTIGKAPSLSFSASPMELLMDVSRQNEANLCCLSSNLTLPDNVQNHESWDLSQFGRTANVQPPPSNLGEGDVVCLSDDED